MANFVDTNALDVAPKAAVRDYDSFTASALNADVIPQVDAALFTDVTIQLTAVATGGTITFQGSMDGTNWVAIAAQPVGAAGLVTTASAAGAWIVPLTMRYFRARQTAWTSGSTTGLARFRVSPTIYRSV